MQFWKTWFAWAESTQGKFLQTKMELEVILSCWQIKVICYMLAQNELHTRNYTEMTLNIMCSLK